MRWFVGALLLIVCAGCGAQELTTTKGVTANESQRQIIYHGDLQLVVPDLSRFETELSDKLAAAGGFVGGFVEERADNHCRHAQWTVRIPVPKFAATVEEIARLGSTVRREMRSEDVTDATIDLDARLKNQRQLEARLLDIVENKAGDLQDVLAVESELSRVRQEIERLDAQRRAMADRVALSTLIIDVREQQDYVPPAASTFGGRVAAAWGASLALLATTGEALVVSMIFLAPWLLLMTLCLAICWWLVRSLRRAGSTT